MSDTPVFPRKCPCGASYDKGAWQKLPATAVVPYVGFGADDPLERADLRVCTCGSPIYVMLPDATSVCTDCHAWIEGGPRIVTPAGVFCSKCGPAAKDECQRFSRSNMP